MATIVSVHGTFAHVPGMELTAGDPSTLYWWQGGSGFEAHARELVRGQDGRLDFVSFVWDSSNSEVSRRAAASGLVSTLRQLDAKNESYCLIGHSHGGSVISSALLESVARGEPLKGLKKWITVGTPFVRMKREPFLFTRLALIQRVLLVASLMLLMMFLFYALAELLDSAPRTLREARITGFIYSGLMMSLPFIVFYTFLKYADTREHYAYGRKPVKQARESYSGKWLHLCHENDEAVQGLRLLPKVDFGLFDRGFAVPALTMASIFALPLLYLLIVTSPPLMVSIADFLKNKVYNIPEYGQAEGPLAKERIDLQRLTRNLRMARREADKTGFDPATEENRRQNVETLRKQVRERRARLNEKYPDFAKVERADRFKRQFLQNPDGTPCEGGKLCGGGHNFARNSKLLFHVVTDELSSAVINDEIGAVARPLRIIIPIVLVPLAFGLVALVLLALIRVIARLFSRVASAVLNRVTLAEIKRSAFGNDTEGEVALSAEQRPSWIKAEYPCLPSDVGDKITDHSNQMSFQSLAKFRNAISTLAFAEGEQNKASLISSYLSWKELIHTAYFDVPEFRKLMAYAISQCDGFTPSETFRRDPDFARSAAWLATLEPKPVD